MNHGEKVKMMRLARDMTLADLGRVVGVTKQTLSGVEHGRSYLGYEQMLILFHKLRFDARWMFDQLESFEDADLTKNGSATKHGLVERIEVLTTLLEQREEETRYGGADPKEVLLHAADLYEKRGEMQKAGAVRSFSEVL